MEKPAILGGSPVTKDKIPFVKISPLPEELDVVEEIIRSRIFVNGPYTRLLEQEFARYLGVKHAIAVSNGTDALFLSYIALGIGFGDKVVTTPVTFIATASTILHVGAIPLFCDVKMDGNIDPDKIHEIRSDGFSAITVVHLYGKPVDMSQMIKIAKERGCFIIEDAAHAHGAKFHGKKIGTFGDIATFSFYPTKIIPAGGWGGIIVTNNDELAEKIRLLRGHGELRILKGPEGAYEYIRLGYNMRISEIEAAIAYLHLKRIDEYIEKRRKLAWTLTELIGDLPGIITPTEENNTKHAFYIYSILIDPSIIGWTRDEFVRALNAEGICARRGYHIPLYATKLFREINNPEVNHLARLQKYPDYSRLKLRNAEIVTSRSVWLPLYPSMEYKEVELIAKAIRKLILWKKQR